MNDRVPPLFVTCLGLASPVGLTPEATAAALRARITAFGDLPYADLRGEPIVGAATPFVDAKIRGRERLVALLSLAFDTVARRIPVGWSLSRLPLAICTREFERPGASIHGLVRELEARIGIKFRRDGSTHLGGGQTAAFLALAHARRELQGSRAPGCLIAAVDSLVDARTLSSLNESARLRTSTGSDGLIPGEAACVCLATSERVAPSSVVVRGLGFDKETATVFNDEPLLGKGMARAVAAALGEAGIGMHEVDFRLADAAGESYGFEELVLSQSRLMRSRRESQELWQPAGSIGDSGAAAGLVQLAWIEQAFARNYAPGAIALAHGSSPGGARAAAVISCQGDGNAA